MDSGGGGERRKIFFSYHTETYSDAEKLTAEREGYLRVYMWKITQTFLPDFSSHNRTMSLFPRN